MEKGMQRERFQLVAEEALADNREYVKEFIDALLSIDDIDQELLDYFYRSDFLNYMQPENLDFCMHLLNERASRDWFMLIHTVYEEDEKDTDKENRQDRDPGNFCKEFEVYYGLGIDIALLWEVYEACASVSDLREKMKPYIRVSNEKDLKKPVLSYAEQNSEIALLRQRVSETEGENRALRDTLDETNERHRDELLSLNVEKQSMNEEIWTLRMEIQHLKDVGVNQNAPKLRYLENEVSQAEERISVLEEMKRSLIEENQELEEDVKTEKNRANLMNEDMSRMSDELRAAYDHIAELEERIEELQKNQKMERTAQEDGRKAGEPEETSPYQEGDAGEEGGDPKEETDRIGGIIRIKDATAQIRKKCNVFARIFSKYQERMFEQKPESDQKNILFMKIMNLNMSTDTIKIIKKSINADGSYLELYKMVTRHATDEEFEQYYQSLGPAA